MWNPTKNGLPKWVGFGPYWQIRSSIGTAYWRDGGSPIPRGKIRRRRPHVESQEKWAPEMGQIWALLAPYGFNRGCLLERPRQSNSTWEHQGTSPPCGIPPKVGSRNGSDLAPIGRSGVQ